MSKKVIYPAQQVVQKVDHTGEKATYRYRIADFTPATAATESLALYGAAGKIVRVTKMTISGDATAAAIYDMYITKRTSPSTGGTFTNPNATKADSDDPAHSATLFLYTANPTALGAGSGMEGDHLYLPAAASPASAPSRVSYEWGTRGDKAPVLRSENEGIAFNFNGQAVPAGTGLYLTIEWTEEDA